MAKEDVMHVLDACHTIPYGGHFVGIGSQVFQSGYFLSTLFKDAHEFAKRCDKC